MADSADQVAELAEKMCGKTLVTKQSGEDGLPVACVYIVEQLQIAREFYFAITLDRKAGGPVIVYSPEGGMAIEDVAAATPEKIFKIPVNINEGVDQKELINAAMNLGLDHLVPVFSYMAEQMYKCFLESDADMVEINPLVLTKKGQLLCLDSKVTVDDNALYRQRVLKEEEDATQKNYKERIADEFDLNYIYIGGDIGCLVNGAGLAMATMDIIKLYGGNPANFLDVGGGAEGEQMIEAIKLLNNDPEVKSILVNIFGGILRCDVLVDSIIKANQENRFEKPIVLRLKGTNADVAKEKIRGKEESLGIHFTEDLDLAARKVCEIANKMN